MQTLDRRPDRGRPDRYALYLLRETPTEELVGTIEGLFRLQPEEAREKVLRASWLGESLLEVSLFDDIKRKRDHLEAIGVKVRMERSA